MNWVFIWAVVISGLFVTFAILLLLVALCNILSAAVGNKGKSDSATKAERKQQKEQLKAQKKAKAEQEKQNKAAFQKENSVSSGISDDVVAAISAAVACVMGKKPFVIRSVKRASNARSAWRSAGIMENTRPF